jgi:hypothetical protein
MIKSVCYLIANQIIKKAPLLLLPILLAAGWNGALLAQCPGCSEPNTNLFPQGFGPHTYTRWKPFTGQQDSNGSTNFQALYMQNFSELNDPAAAVAAIEGFDSQPVTALTKLQFDRRTSNNGNLETGCTATSPRFSIRTKDSLGNFNKFSIGCLTMPVTATSGPFTDSKGNVTNWETRTANQVMIMAATGAAGPGAIIISIAIIYDDGAKLTLPGFAYLDNITVCATNLPSTCKTWTQPSDNSEK